MHISFRTHFIAHLFHMSLFSVYILCSNCRVPSERASPPSQKKKKKFNKKVKEKLFDPTLFLSCRGTTRPLSDTKALFSFPLCKKYFQFLSDCLHRKEKFPRLRLMHKHVFCLFCFVLTSVSEIGRTGILLSMWQEL